MRACLILLTLACAGCVRTAPGPRALPVVPPGSGLLYVYLDALPPEADGVRAELAGLRALGADGNAVPLPLALDALDASLPRRQRLLAAGPVPARSYVGLELEIASARLGEGDRAAALALPAPTRLVEQPFAVADQRVAVLRLGFARDVPVVRGHAFEPELAAGLPRASELAPDATAVAVIDGPSALAVFHKIDGQVFDILRTGEGPSSVAYDPDRQRAYVACAGADVVESFDLTRGTREQSHPLLLGDRPSGLALTRDGLTLVVANAGSNTVTVLDAPSLAERFRVTVGRDPVAVRIHPSGQRAIVFQLGNDSLAVVDLVRGVVLGTVVVDGGPVHGAFDPRGELLYVVHRHSPYLVVVDVDELRVTTRQYVGSGALAIAVDPRGGRVFLSRAGSAGLEVFDPPSLLPVQTVDLGGAASGLAIDGETEQLLAAVPEARQVRILRLNGLAPSAATDLGGAPVWGDVAGSRDGP